MTKNKKQDAGSRKSAHLAAACVLPPASYFSWFSTGIAFPLSSPCEHPVEAVQDSTPVFSARLVFLSSHRRGDGIRVRFGGYIRNALSRMAGISTFPQPLLLLLFRSLCF